MCGLDAAFLINLLIAGIVIALAFAIIRYIVGKVPFLAEFATIILWIFWAIVAIFVLGNVVLPLLKCAGL